MVESAAARDLGKKEAMEDAYCENGDCRVTLYQTEREEVEEKQLAAQNCPSCGRFGRLKDKPSK